MIGLMKVQKDNNSKTNQNFQIAKFKFQINCKEQKSNDQISTRSLNFLNTYAFIICSV